MVEVNEHYRPTTDSHASGIYRVVGATGNVTLLRVTDAEGKRAFTGEVHRVSPPTLDTEFEAADGPGSGFSPASIARNVSSSLYWSVRRLL